MKKIRTITHLIRVFVSKSLLAMLVIGSLPGGIILAQSGGITLNVHDTTLVAVLNEIKNQTDINIVFNHELVNKAPKVSVSLKNASLKEALTQSLKNSHLDFQIRNNTVIIQPKMESEILDQLKPPAKTQTLRGRVIDREAKIGLPFANVVVLNTSPVLGVITDEQGYFRIENLELGRHSLKVTYVGYETAIIPEILVGSAKEVVMSVELSESLEDLDEAVVSVKKSQPLNEMATISGKSFSVEETKRYAASISDPARMAQVFAGVSTTDDSSNEIVIRGNSPNWMLWRLEGVEIPSPNHFAEEGYTAGAVSILSTNMLGKSDFYTGAFPAEYGNALSGVFDMRLRNGNNETREYSFQVGVLGAEAAVEGPFKKGYRGSYLINYRYATFSLLNDINIEVTENTLPNYQDLSFKFNLPAGKAGNFSLWGIGGLSDTDGKFYPDTTLDEKFYHGYTDYTKTGMYASGLSHTIFPDQKSYIKTVFSVSGNLSSEDRSDMDSSGVLHPSYFDDFNTSAYRISSYYNRKFSKQLTLRSGFVLSQLNYDYHARTTNEEHEWEQGIDGKGQAELYQAYLQGKFKFNDFISLTTGVHYSHFALSNDNSIEPRAGLQINLKNDQKLGFGFGIHSKNENLPVYFVAFQNEDGSSSYLNKSLELTRSAHYVVSYEKIIARNWMVKAETYYQDISKLPVPNNPDKRLAPAFNGASPQDTLVNEGSGRNYGVELTIQRFFTNQYYLLFSSSLYESEYKPLDGNWYNTRFNSNYTFNLVGGKEIAWGDNKMLSLNGKVLWSGGKRMIPVDEVASADELTTVFNMDEIYSIKAPDYFRFDIGIKLHIYKKKVEHILSLDIQNVTNRLNVWYQYYSVERDDLANAYMAGLIPILNYRIEF